MTLIDHGLDVVVKVVKDYVGKRSLLKLSCGAVLRRVRRR